MRRGKTGSDTEWNGEAVTARLGFAGLRMARRLGHVRVGSGPARRGRVWRLRIGPVEPGLVWPDLAVVERHG